VQQLSTLYPINDNAKEGAVVMYWGKDFLVLALGVTLIAAGTAEAVPLKVNGEVTTPLTLDADALGGTPVSATIGGVVYSGSSVYSLISDAGFQNNPAQAKNGYLLDYLAITGTGGQSVVLSEGQIDPNFGGQTANPQSFIATTANGLPIAPRLIVQSDPNGTTDGYDLTGVTNIKVGWAAVPAFSTSVLSNESSLTVTGKIASSPVSYSTGNFSSVFPTQTTQTDSFLSGSTPTTATFTGQGCSTLSTEAPLGYCMESVEGGGVSVLAERPGLIASQYVVAEAADPGEHTWVMTDARLILLEGHVADVMQFVLNVPMASDRGC
jgi:hypothetical protein